MTIRAPIFLMIIVILAMVIPQIVSAETVQWVAPTERTDNSPLPQSEIGGFRLYYTDNMLDPTNYTSTVDIIDPMARSVVIPDSSGGRAIVMTTYDTDGREGPFSTALVRRAPPKPPIVSIAVTPTDRVVPIQ